MRGEPNFLETDLFSAEGRNRRDQRSSTSRFMTFVGNCNIVDNMTWISFGNLAVVMPLDGTTARISDAGDRDAIHRKMLGAPADDLAAMRGWVTETDHVAHRSAVFLG